MKKTILALFLVLTLGIVLTSCSTIVTGLYGIKCSKQVDEATILKFGKKYNIPEKDSYKLDTAYFSFLFSLDTAKYKSHIQNHYQPLQVLYYDHTGCLKSFQVNCYAGGFPNLKWERDGTFSVFVPKQQAPLDSIVPLETQLKYLVPFSKTEMFSTGSYDYVVVVHWSKFMGRQSKRLIKLVQGNEKLSGGKKVRILYVNNDNIFAQEEIGVAK